MVQEAQGGSLGDAANPAVNRSKAIPDTPHVLSFKEKLKVMSGEGAQARIIRCLLLCEKRSSEGFFGGGGYTRVAFHDIKASETNSHEAKNKEERFCFYLSSFKKTNI